MPANWYTLHSHPRKEDLLWTQVNRYGFESYYPRVRVHPVNPRARKIQPYFPGYLFVKVDLDKVGRSLFQWMPFGTGLVSFGDEPAVVPEILIHTLKRRIAEIADAGGLLFDELHPGDEVVIHSGVFAGYEAIFDAKLPGSERVRVLLKMIKQNRSIPVELNAGTIRPKKSSATWGSK